MMSKFKEIYFSSRSEWRSWLKDNHTKIEGIWFIYYKKDTQKQTVPYEDSVEEALCFGWIDSIIKKIDDQRYARKFTIRKNESAWSESNKKRVAKLIKSGLMTEAGLEKIRRAKQNGHWEQVIKIPEFLDPPPEFKAALDKNKAASRNFNKLASSYRRQYIGWISTAKKEETRLKRISEAINLLNNNQKLGLK